MNDEQRKRLRAHVNGFRGRFFYDAERGDIAWIAKACDDKHCDCERKVNADGDQDCAYSLYDWEGEDHINEPIVEMLNAVPALLDEVERLTKERDEARAEAMRDRDHLMTLLTDAHAGLYHLNRGGSGEWSVDDLIGRIAEELDQ